MMYNVAQPNAQTQMYDSQHFGSRQPAALQMMTPDATSTYFGGPATDNTSPDSASLQQPGQDPGSSSTLYQPGQTIKYSNDMSSVNVPGQHPQQQQQQQPAQDIADISMSERQEFSDGALKEKWHIYQRQLATVFQDISSESLVTASETLLSISNWLLSQVVELGKCRECNDSSTSPPTWCHAEEMSCSIAAECRTLMHSNSGLTTDDASLHAERIKLWDDFNHAWLALGQKQCDLMQDPQHQARSSRILTRDTIENLGDEIVRLCNDLERHGLVDYQYGVWEEQITESKRQTTNVNVPRRDS
jgi:hypothetical protein